MSRYFTVQEFMIKDLNLKGNKLMIYAIIYGFSQDNKSSFEGSISYISEWIGASKETSHRLLKELIDDGLIIEEKTSGYHKWNKYRTNIEQNKPSFENQTNRLETKQHRLETKHNNNTYTNTNNNESKEKVFSNLPEDVRFNKLLTSQFLNDKLINLEKVLSLEEFDKRNYPEKFKDYKNAELWYNLVIKANHLKEPPVEWMNSKVSTVAKAVLDFIQNQQVMKVIQKIQNGHIQNIEVLPHNFISKFNRYE